MNEKVVDIDTDERKTHDLQSVGKMIMPFARRILGAKGFVETDILTRWEEIVGEDLAGVSSPKRIDFKRGEKTNGILLIEVPAGAFALELQHRENVILGKVNAFFGYAAVARLKVVQNNSGYFDKADDLCERLQKTLVTKEEETYIRKLSEGVQSQALQNALFKLGCGVLEKKKREKNKNES